MVADCRKNLTPIQIQEHCQAFSGSEEFFRHWTRKLIYTQGIDFLVESCEAYWLLDIIASYQAKCAKDDMLCDFQIWTVKVVNKGRTATVTCLRDTDDVAFTQEIEYTDFPLSEIKLYCERGEEMTVMLPNER
jgi:hypothetical protein